MFGADSITLSAQIRHERSSESPKQVSLSVYSLSVGQISVSFDGHLSTSFKRKCTGNIGDKSFGKDEIRACQRNISEPIAESSRFLNKDLVQSFLPYFRVFIRNLNYSFQSSSNHVD